MLCALPEGQSLVVLNSRSNLTLGAAPAFERRFFLLGSIARTRHPKKVQKSRRRRSGRHVHVAGICDFSSDSRGSRLRVLLENFPGFSISNAIRAISDMVEWLTKPTPP